MKKLKEILTRSLAPLTRTFAMLAVAFAACHACADAPAPVAVWDGNFEATQTGYTLNLNDNSLSSDKSTITISQSVGVTVTKDDNTFSSGFTVLFKYSDLNLSLAARQVLAATKLTDAGNRTGAEINASGKACGIWDGSSWDTTGTYNTMTSGQTAGVLAYTHYSTANNNGGGTGTQLFYLKSGSCATIVNAANLGSTKDTSKYEGFSVGGPTAAVTGDKPTSAATGMKITGIAVFSGVLTEEQMTSYVWPRYKNWDYVATGRVLTWKTSPDATLDNGTGQKITVADTTYSVFNIKDGTDGETYSGGATANSGAHWHYFAFQQTGKYSSPGSTMRFVGSDTYAKNIRADYSPLTLGGLIVDKGATGYSIAEDASNTGSRRDNRATILGSQPASESETWFRFCEDFTFGRQGALAFVGKVNLEIESGKTVTVQSKQNSSSETFIPKVCSSVTINSDNSGALATLTAGGTLRLHGAGKLTAPGVDASSATLDFSDIGSRYNDETPFLNCQLTVDANTTFILPNGITLPYTYKVATSISASEAVPSATWTDANGNVFTHAATVDEENGTITVNLANATTITVNGALTLNGATAADITVNANNTLTLDSSAVLSGTVTGDGSIAISNSVNLSEAVSVTVANLYLTGSSLTFGTGVEMEVTTMLRTTHAGASDCTITQTGGSLTCSGPANDSSYKLGAFVLSHWGAITTYTLSGGSLTVNNSTAKFGADGTGNMTISGTGVANFHSLSLRRGTLTVDAGGTLNLGAAGQTTPVSRNEGNLTLNGGTIGAWNSTAITIPVPVTVSGNTTIRAATVSGAAANIIFTGAITGSGNLTIAGGGKVVFAGDMSGYTGSFAVGAGTLEVPSGVSVASIAAGAEVVVTTSSAPSTLNDAIVGGYSLAGSLTIPETVDGTITLVDVNGNAATNPGSTWENNVRSFTGTAPVNGSYTGNKWWWDYEFNGNVTCIGSDTGDMTQEGYGTSFTAADSSGNQELYFQKTPYRSATFSDKNALTAVMYCQPGNYANTVLVGFGTTYNPGVAVALVTGANPASGEMKLVLIQRSGNNVTVTSLADLTAVGATTTKHLYAFVIDRITEDATEKTRIRVYLDGKVKAIYKHNGTLNLTNGFQIGSLYGGVKETNGAWDTELVKYPDTGNSGTLDFLRMIDGSLTDEAMAALANAYPYVSSHGEATRDPVSSSANFVATDVWTQTVPGQDATQDAPNADTNVKLSIDGSSAVYVALNLEADSNYESLTLSKEAGATGSLKLTSAYGNNTSGKLVSAETSVLVDTTIPAGRVNLGVTSLADGITLTVDPYSPAGNTALAAKFNAMSFGEVYSDVVISMALLGDGASVALDETNKSSWEEAGFTIELLYDSSNLSYTLQVTREQATADIAVDIAAGGKITWSTRTIAVPAPASLPDTYVGTVTITSAATDPVTIATAFAGGNVTVAAGGPVMLTGDITTSGTVTLNGATTLSGNTVSSALTGSGAVTIDGTVTLADGGSIANTISGTGTIDCSGRSSVPGAFTFGSWTGTVVLPSFVAAGENFNNYGIANSKVELTGITSGWLAMGTDNTEFTINPEIVLAGNMTLTDSSTRTWKFSKISGAGAISLTPGSLSYQITVTISELVGKDVSIVNNMTPGLTVTKLTLASAPSAGDIILSTTTPNTVTVSSVYVDDSQQGIIFEKKTDGIYAAATESTTTVTIDETPVSVIVLDTGSNTSIDATGISGKVAIPGTVTQITGVAARDLLLKVTYNNGANTEYYSGILALDDSGNVSLVPDAEVNDVTVSPVLGDTEPMVVSDEAVPTFKVKAIPGLWYQVVTGTELTARGALGGTPGYGTAIQAVGATVSPVAPAFPDSGNVQYYRIKVGATSSAME